LEGLVRGGGNGDGAGPGKMEAGPSTIHPALDPGRGGRKSFLSPGKSRALSTRRPDPEQVIPLGEGDFKEFKEF